MIQIPIVAAKTLARVGSVATMKSMNVKRKPFSITIMCLREMLSTTMPAGRPSRIDGTFEQATKSAL